MNIQELITRYATQYGVDPELALKVANTESGFNPNAISPKGAIGVMQLMPQTAKMLGVDPYDIEQNIEGGIRYLRQMLDEFGDVNLALAAYNAGPEAVKKYGGVPPYRETQQYIRKINATAPQSDSDEEILRYYFPQDFEKVTQIEKPTKTATDEEILRYYFPEDFKRQITVEIQQESKQEPLKTNPLEDILAHFGKGMMRPVEALIQMYYGLTDKEKLKQYTEQRKAEEKIWQEAYPSTATRKATEFVGEILPQILLFRRIPSGALGGSILGGTAGLLSPVENAENFWGQKAFSVGLGGLLGGATGKIADMLSGLFRKPQPAISPDVVQRAEEAAKQLGTKITPAMKTGVPGAISKELYYAGIPGSRTSKIYLENQFKVNKAVNEALQKIAVSGDDEIANQVNTQIQKVATDFAKNPNFIDTSALTRLKEAIKGGYKLLDEKKNAISENIPIPKETAADLVTLTERAKDLGAVIPKELNRLTRKIKKGEEISLEPIEVTNLAKTLRDKISDYYEQGLGTKAKALDGMLQKINGLFPEKIVATEQSLNQAYSFVNVLKNAVKQGNVDMRVLSKQLSDYGIIREPYNAITEFYSVFPELSILKPRVGQTTIDASILGKIAKFPLIVPATRKIDEAIYYTNVPKSIEWTAFKFLPLATAITAGKIGGGLLD